MRLLLLGASGMFGTDALPLFRSEGFDAAGEDFPGVDITARPSLEACMDRHDPDIVVNAAAFTRVDEAEAHPDEAHRINAVGAGEVARACQRRGALLVQISTDYVFPGEKPEGYLPSDPPGPALGAYGASKLEGELAVRARLSPDRLLICRTQWLYGSTGDHFVGTIVKLAASMPEIRVVDDQWGVPTTTRDLARQILSLLSLGASGTYHTVGGGGPITWHAFAAEAVSQAGIPCTVMPCASEAFPRPARRPKFAWLKNRGVPAEAIQPWVEGLADHLAERGFTKRAPVHQEAP